MRRVIHLKQQPEALSARQRGLYKPKVRVEGGTSSLTSYLSIMPPKKMDPRPEVKELAEQNELKVTYDDDKNVGDQTNALWVCTYYLGDEELAVGPPEKSKADAKKSAAEIALKKLNARGYCT